MSYLVTRKEDGDITLTPCKLLGTESPMGPKISTVNLSGRGVAVLWFIKFLSRDENCLDTHEAAGRIYRASYDAAGNLFLEDKRNEEFNVVGFSEIEIPDVLAKLTEAPQESD